MKILSRNFYDVFLRERSKAKKVGWNEIVLAIPDKQQKGWEFEQVDESLEKLHSEGYKIRIDMQNERFQLH